MLKPIAFGDEQLDADLREILGPWKRYSIQTASIGTHINHALEDASNGSISFSEGTVVLDGRPFRIIGAIPIIEVLAACKKASLTIPVAVVVAILGLGLGNVTKRSLEDSSLERSNGNLIVESRQSIPAKTIRSITLEPPVFSSKAAPNWQSRDPQAGLAKQHPTQNLVNKPKTDFFSTKVTRLTVLARAPLREDIADDVKDTPIVNTTRDLETSSSQSAQLANDGLKSAQAEGSLDATASNIARARNRRDSVEALRFLRRQ